MNAYHRQPEPGEWQEEKNAFGGVRHFRMVNGIKEYEMIVTVDGMSIPESQVEAYNQRRKAQLAAKIERSRQQAEQQTYCPFFGGGKCKGEKCALYGRQDCALSEITGAEGTDTSGKICPFNGAQCRADCGLYKNGCVLTAIKERM